MDFAARIRYHRRTTLMAKLTTACESNGISGGGYLQLLERLLEMTSEIEKAFEAGFRAYRDAFDHYDDNDETVEHSLKWRMAEYVAKQDITNTPYWCWECNLWQKFDQENKCTVCRTARR